jgi:hypothetical protein
MQVLCHAWRRCHRAASHASHREAGVVLSFRSAGREAGACRPAVTASVALRALLAGGRCAARASGPEIEL